MTRLYFSAADFRQTLHSVADRAEDVMHHHCDVAASLWFNARLVGVHAVPAVPRAAPPPPPEPTPPEPPPASEPALDAAAIYARRRAAVEAAQRRTA